MRSDQRRFLSIISILFMVIMFYGLYEKLFSKQFVASKKQQFQAENLFAPESALIPTVPIVRGNSTIIKPKSRNDNSVAVTIVVVLSTGPGCLQNCILDAYKTALNSVQCYAALHGYTLLIEFDDKFRDCQVHQDIYFRRHCHTMMLMQKKIKNNEWILFLDGDVGVINPTRLIEEYLETGYEIYLFDRFFIWEYAALSYLVKNNERGRAWVNEFASFEFKLPKSFHGTDNGALHPFMMFYLVPETRKPETRSRMADLCFSLWNRSSNYDGLFMMEACTRMVIGERIHFPEQKVKIYSKGYGWAQDLGMFHSHWSTENFMMHNVKERLLKQFPIDAENQKKYKNALDTLQGYNAQPSVFPVLKRLNVEKCKNGTEEWMLEYRLHIDNDTRRNVLGKMANKILKKQLESVGSISKMVLDSSHV